MRPDLLDKLLDLVERNRSAGTLPDGDALPDARNDSPDWSYNHEFWVEQLRAETGHAWSEDQYEDAARLLNFAEQRRAILREALELASSTDVADDGTGPGGSGSISPDDIMALLGELPDQIPLRGSADQAGPEAPFDGAELPVPGSRLNAEPPKQPLARADDTSERSRDAANPGLGQVRTDLLIQSSLAGLQLSRHVDPLQDGDGAGTVVLELRAAPTAELDPADVWAIGLPRVPGAGAEIASILATAPKPLTRLTPIEFEELLDTVTTARQRETDSDQTWARGGGESAVARNLNAAEADTAAALTSGPAGLTIIGSDDNDVLTGGAGNDLLIGEAGDDVIAGGDGDDVVFGGSGHDRISGGGGQDRLAGGSGNDIVSGGLGDDVISGDSGDDVLSGNEGRDHIAGGTGQDRISGGSADDRLAGGAGNDHVSGDGGDDDVEGGSGDDVLAGGSGSDVVAGGSGDDVLRGGDQQAGDDGHVDLLIGGLGNDTIYIEDAGDKAIEQAGEGTDTAATTLNVYVLPENVEVLVFFGTGDIHATGNAEANVIIGGAGSDTLDGAGGADTLAGGSGNDLYIVSHDGDVVIELSSSGTDTVETTLTAYVLSENVEILTYTGHDGFSGEGNASDNVITGGAADDFLQGLAGNDTFYGGAGDDWIDGGEGDDVVLGGEGSDFVLFTRGSDTLVLMPGFGNDTVMGFDTDSSDTGSRDRIDVSHYGFSESAFGVDILLVYDGEATTVRIGLDSVRLVMVDVSEVDRSSFIFS